MTRMVLLCDGPYNGGYVEVEPWMREGDRIAFAGKCSSFEVDEYELVHWPVMHGDEGELVGQYARTMGREEEALPDFVTGTEQELVQVHEATDDCYAYGCSIHAPSDHVMSDFPLHFREDRGLMERICPHNVGHPDPDHLARVERRQGREAASVESIHGCDGCCMEVNTVNPEFGRRAAA